MMWSESDRTDTESTTPTDETASIDDIVVVGTGFIGLPLSLLLADHGKRVVGVDIDQNLVNAINNQTLNIDEEELQKLLAKDIIEQNLEARTEPVEGDAFVISVPTPLAEPTKNPDLSFIIEAVDSILPHLEPGNLINIESTIPPLTCKDIIIPKLENAGYTPGEDIQVAHSPERILPGNVFEEIVHNDRIIGGIDDISRRRAAKIYEPFLQGDIYYTDLLSAELCKLMENTFRDVNVALANEFALIGEDLDINMSEVINLANNHPRVDILTPGIGVGGHCLPVDPWFLNEVDPEHTNLITTARRINDKMPDVATQKVRRALSEFTAPKIVALGAAYKPNTGDRRNSPAEYIADDLRADGYSIKHYDRHVDGLKYEDLKTVLIDEQPDVVLQLVPHEATVTELDQLKKWLKKNEISLLQFGSDDPLNP